MGPEVWVGVVAVFISGGAIGASGTLLAQWLLGKIGNTGAPPPRTLRDGEVELLRAEVSDMDRMLRNIDARLDFQEQLLGGGTPTSAPPPRLEEGSADPPEPLEPPAE